MIRVFIIAEVRLYRDGLEFTLSRRPNIDVIGSAAVAVERFDDSASPPDVVLVDMSSEDAHVWLEQSRRAAPEAKMVALGLPERAEDVVRCVELGIAGYVPRAEGSLDELVETIESVVRGETFCSPKITATLFARVAALASESRVEPTLARLTSRQLEVARLLRRGLSNKEIASSLRIELPTAKNHVHAVLDKLGVHRRSEAAAHLAVMDLGTGSRSWLAPQRTD